MDRTVTLAIAGDVMLGRLVNEAIAERGVEHPWGPGDGNRAGRRPATALARAVGRRGQGRGGPPMTTIGPHARHRGVLITVGDVHLPGDLVAPPAPIGGVIFAHGSGSSRHSPRNIQVAQALQGGGLATLLFDLLSEVEARDRRNVFDIALLASRLGAATEWLRRQPEVAGLRIGYFGASTGAAAALWAAAEPGARVGAIVSRGGRPDLAGPRLGAVTAPTLLIVGGDDPLVLELNRQAQQTLSGTAELTIIPGATHLFEEPGALEQVADLARAWFVRYLRAGAAGAA